MPQFRDPIHGFIFMSEAELKIVNSAPFQRLRHIRQLATTYLVYHGAEHTRFGHSLGVMHLTSRVFDSVTSKTPNLFSDDSLENDLRTAWYRQILRLIALAHDLGHAPFSHAGEGLFPDGLEHEHYTRKIIEETEIASYITEIGAALHKEFLQDKRLEKYEFSSPKEQLEKFNIRPITPQLLWMIYEGKQELDEAYILPDFKFLKSFMDSELDCDKMDYLLRDSLYCGVTYGKYDLERFVSSLRAYKNKKENSLSLAICSGGVQAFEEFVLARYFMFIQVYFHKTRKHFDRLLVGGLKEILPNGLFPETIGDYLLWDDTYVLQKMKSDAGENAKKYLERKPMTCVYETPAHAGRNEKRLIQSWKEGLEREFPHISFKIDDVGKSAHKLLPPVYAKDKDNENEVKVIDKHTGNPESLMEQSLILNGIKEDIYICRLYADADSAEDVEKIKEWLYSRMKD